MSDDLRQAEQLLAVRRPDAAAAAALRHLQREPESIAALLVLARAQSAAGRHADAVASAGRAVAAAPENAGALLMLSAVQYDAGMKAAAKANVQRTLALAPTLPGAHYIDALARSGDDPAAALAAAARARRFLPQNADYAWLHAHLLFDLGRIDEAETSALAALRLDPGHGKLLALHGQLLMRRGDARAAEAAFLAALRGSPQLEAARKGLLEALRSRNRLYAVVVPVRQWLLQQLRSPRRRVVVMALIVAGGAGVEPGTGWLQVPRIALLTLLCVVPHLGNLALLAHPLGRHVLTRKERALTFVIAALLATSAVAGLVALVAGSAAAADVAGGAAAAVMLVALLDLCLPSTRMVRWRRVFLLVVIGMLLLLLLARMAGLVHPTRRG